MTFALLLLFFFPFEKVVFCVMRQISKNSISLEDFIHG